MFVSPRRVQGPAVTGTCSHYPLQVNIAERYQWLEVLNHSKDEAHNAAKSGD
jgi:hypothetical protein